MKKDIFNRALPIIATSLAQQTNIEITIGGNQAYTTGTSINLPDYELDSPDDIKLVKGYLAHESAHIRYNSFAVNLNSLTPFSARLLNVIEDVRIEREMVKDFKGTKSWLNHIPKMLLAKNLMGTLTDQDNVGDIFTFFILYAARAKYNDQIVLTDYVKNLELLFISKFGKVALTKSKGLMSTIPDLINVHDSLILVEQLIKMLKQEQEEQNKASAQADTQAQADAQADAQAQADTQAQADAQADAQAITDNINSALSSTEEQLRETDLGDIVRSVLDQQQQNGSHFRGNDSKLIGFEDKCLTNQSAARIFSVKKYSNNLSAKLQNLIQSKQLVRTKEDVTGSLNTRKLYRSAIGDRHIFIDRQRRKTQGASIHFCMDNSGSMDIVEPSCGFQRYKICRDAILSLAVALEPLKGVTTSATVFPFLHTKNVGVLKHESDNIKLFANRLYDLTPNYGTPIGYGYFQGMRELIKSKQDNKILFLFTDGDFNYTHHDLLIETYKASLKYNVKTFAVGISKDANMERLVDIFGKDNCCLITDLSELKTKLFSLCKNIIR